MRKMQQLNPMVDIVQYQLEASMQLADVVFSGTEKIDRAVLDVTHDAVERQIKFARAVTNMRDPSQMAELQTTLAHRPERTIQCQQQIMSAFAEMQAEFGKSIQNYMEHFSHAATSRANTGVQASEAAGEQANAMFNPMTSVLSMWETAFREATTLANRNLMAARSTIESAANAAGEAVSHAVEAVDIEDSEHSEKKHGSSRRK